MRKPIVKKILIIITMLSIAIISTIIRENVSWWGIPNILVCISCGIGISVFTRKDW